MTRPIRILSILTLTLLCATASLRAQFNSTITSQPSSANAASLGNDIWFAVPQNGVDQQGKYISIALTSPTIATVRIESGKQKFDVHLTPNTTTNYQLPLSWEIKTNDFIESKAIHLWSEARFSATLLSHAPYSSDNTYLLPTLALGTEYAVAAYAASERDSGDHPSEFVIAATADSTDVEITPSTDLRSNLGGKNSPQHIAGGTFTIRLDRGQAVQYKCTVGRSSALEDVTGTKIHSTKPIALLGATQAAEIDSGHQYADYLLEMLPPMSSWGKTYYSAPTNRQSGDAFLVIGSAAGQTIQYRSAHSSPPQTIIQFTKPCEAAWTGIAEGARWSSTEPFLLVRYTNASTVDCNTCLVGGLSMSLVLPLENMPKQMIFQSSVSPSGQPSYQNYADIIANQLASDSTRLDGKAIQTRPGTRIDDMYGITRITNIPSGTHTLQSDSGVSVLTYGFGTNEAISTVGIWPLSIADISGDTIPPTIDTLTRGVCFLLTLYDSSGISGAVKDSGVNITVQQDSTILKGLTPKTATVTICALDSTRPARGSLTIFDRFGNPRHIEITFVERAYVAPIRGFAVADTLRFGNVIIGQSATLALPVMDTSGLPMQIDSIWSDKPDFMPSGQGGILVAARSQTNLSLTFEPTSSGLQQATIFFHSADGLFRQTVTLGTGIPVASVGSDQVSGVTNAALRWHLLPLAPNPARTSVSIHYDVKESCLMSIEIFSMLGERMVVDRFNAAESGGRSIDVRTLPPGSYIVRMEALGEVHSAKLTIR